MKTKWLASLAVAALVSGCGGADPLGLSGIISGIAATGAAIGSQPVRLKCVAGSPTAPAVTDPVTGKFTFNVSNVTLPCLAEVDDGTGNLLHTFVNALGTANISPVTEMVVGSLLGTTPQTAFANLDAARLGSVTTAQVTTALAAVKTKLQGLGVDTTNFGDPLAGNLVAGSGQGLDGVLDALKVKRGTTTIAALTGELVASSPNQGGSSASAGYPATATYTGKTADNQACSITVGADHGVTASVAGQSLSGVLDGGVFSLAAGEIAPAVVYAAASKFYEARSTTAYDAASAATPYVNVGLNLDATTGKLIMASGQRVTDASGNPAAGANFSFVCAGESYPSGTPIGSTGFNVAAASRFQASSLVGGPYNAPTANSQACSFAVDSTGNATVTWAGFSTTGGKLLLPSGWLSVPADQSSTQAKYEVYYSKTSGALLGNNFGGQVVLGANDTNYDWFSVTLKAAAGVKQVAVLANGLGSDGKSVTCSTANDPAGKWAQVASYVGTWTGTKDTNFHFGSNASCQLVVAADGSMTYTGTDGVAYPVSQTAGWSVSVGGSGFFSFAKGSAPTVDMDFTGASVSGRKPQLFYWKSGASYEYCNSMAKL